jgi:DNA polymerase-3 subunit epsilon
VAAYKFYCQKDLTNAHSAEADTTATYEILEAMLDKYEGAEFVDKKGNVSQPVVNDIKALSEFSTVNRNVDLIGHIVLNENDEEVFNFGKNKGRLVSEVFTKEPSYYDWMMKGQFPEYTKKVITKIKLKSASQGNMRLF